MKRALALALLAAACASADPRAFDAAVVNPKLYASERFDLEAARGTHDAVVVSFGASYCEPCWLELPHLVKLAERYERVAFVLVLTEPPPGVDRAARAVRERFRVPFAVVADPDGRVGDAYAVKSLPTIAVLSAEGREVWREEGFKGGTIDELDGLLGRLVKRGGR
jgi:thiol-disulfide isomerase/thioredoxin